MAITPTPNNNIFKGLVFDGIDSRDYGIYITGSAVFNSPERDVEMIEIPGRNGSYALDNGRFNNIEVTYPAGLFGGSEADFAAGIRAFRNAIASRIGYKRLEDDYNPTEYRMAVYKSGLDVTPAQLKAGEFEITCDCQPQRFLKSGETAVSVEDGDTITNPTLFDASPILKVYGYGNIVLGDGGTVSVSDDVIVGNTVLANGGQVGLTYTESIVIGSDKFMTGDIITLAHTSISVQIGARNVTSVTASVASGYSVNTSATKINSGAVAASVSWDEETFTVGTSRDLSTTVNVSIVTSGGNVVVQIPATISYNASTRTITRTLQTPTAISGTISSIRGHSILGSITGYSTAPAYTEPLYFDLSIGEAYAIEGGVPVSINGAVSFGVDLPVLPPGVSTITYDNTIDGLEIIPRWWEV